MAAVIKTPVGKMQIMYHGGPHRLCLYAFKEGGGHYRYTAGNCIGSFYLVRSAKGWQVPSHGERAGSSWRGQQVDIDVEAVIPAAAEWAERNPPNLLPKGVEHDVWWLNLYAERLTKELREYSGSFVGRVDALCPEYDRRELTRIARLVESLGQAVSQVADSVKGKVSVETPGVARRAA